MSEATFRRPSEERRDGRVMSKRDRSMKPATLRRRGVTLEEDTSGGVRCLVCGERWPLDPKAGDDWWKCPNGCNQGERGK
jgi:hypothetical protein